jgi:DNA repair protein RadA/Sms
MHSMAREKSEFSCSECGATSPKWLGKCPGCGAWNTLVEGVAESAGRHRFQALAKSAPVTTLAEIEASDVMRTPTGQEELDRVLGGGIVPGGVVLIGGDPGIGKSARAALGWTARRCACWQRSSSRRSWPRSTPRRRPSA